MFQNYVKLADLSQKNIFGNNPPQIVPSWIKILVKPGFGSDSGPNLQPCSPEVWAIWFRPVGVFFRPSTIVNIETRAPKALSLFQHFTNADPFSEDCAGIGA